MLEVRYVKLVPYSLPVVLSQYYDWEHIEHVHPETLGRYELLENDGDRAVYEHVWPRGFFRRLFGRPEATSVVEQTFLPPREIRFDFLSGKNRGVQVISVLEEAEGGCTVDETYRMPGIPNWELFRRLALPSIRKRVDLIWDEDIDVDVCHGGWPGVPESARDTVPGLRPPDEGDAQSDEEWVDLGVLSQFPEGRPVRAHLAEDLVEMSAGLVVVRQGDRVHVLEARCPHSGGPLALGTCSGEEIVCPWHGARFSLRTGEVVEGRATPTKKPLAMYAARLEAGRVKVKLALV